MQEQVPRTANFYDSISKKLDGSSICIANATVHIN